jgi:hypothetical protein
MAVLTDIWYTVLDYILSLHMQEESDHVTQTIKRDHGPSHSDVHVSESLPPQERPGDVELHQPHEQVGVSGKVESARPVDEEVGRLRGMLKKGKNKKTTMPQVRDPLTVRVETIMSEGFRDTYQELSPVQKEQFKIKGEETALKIRSLLRGTNVKVRKIFQLLIEWLVTLPGINRFYLEQEAKIKADKIIGLKER